MPDCTCEKRSRPAPFCFFVCNVFLVLGSCSVHVLGRQRESLQVSVSCTSSPPPLNQCSTSPSRQQTPGVRVWLVGGASDGEVHPAGSTRRSRSKFVTMDVGQGNEL